MKNFIHTLSYFLIFFTLAIPGKTFAQCLCTDGTTPEKLEHTFQLTPTTASSSIISFPKFPIALGTLFCVTLFDTLSIVAQTGARNLDAASGHEPSFQLTLTTNVKGPNQASPSITISDLINVMYGPDSLQKYGTPGDSITYGPDTVYNRVRKQRSSSSNMTDYYSGPGNVEFLYDISGGAIPVFDGTNYSVTVRTSTWGSFRLVYNWCPNAVLASNIKNFSAYKKDKNILLKWAIENNVVGNTYEMEYSEDGRNFSSLGSMDASRIAGNINQNEFQYVPGISVAKKLYFRIRQEDAFGKVTYSSIRTVNMNENSPAGFIVYPNPVSRKVSMQFDRTLNGNYSIEVTNLAGQILYNRNVKLNNSNSVHFELNNPPPSGLYYLKITDTKSQLSYSNKLIIKR